MLYHPVRNKHMLHSTKNKNQMLISLNLEKDSILNGRSIEFSDDNFIMSFFFLISLFGAVCQDGEYPIDLFA